LREKESWAPCWTTACQGNSLMNCVRRIAARGISA